MKLISTRVAEPWAVERMRQMFNAVLPALSTRPLQPRTPQEQQDWWKSLDRSRVVALLYATVEEPWEFIGFSMVTFRPGGFTTPIYGLDPKAQGRGLGELILKDYLRIANGPLAGEDLVTNPAVVKLNDRNGWQVITQIGDTRLLYHPGLAPYESKREEVCRYFEKKFDMPKGSLR